jgi:hypothetical protein
LPYRNKLLESYRKMKKRTLRRTTEKESERGEKD